MIEMKKRCTKCDIEKDLSEFYMDHSWCKECFKDYYRENKEHIKEQHKRYDERNKEHKKEWNKKYYEKNKDYHNEWVKEYFKTPNGKAAIRRAGHKHRASMRNIEATLTAKEWAYILKKQNNRCNRCGKRFSIKNPPTQDHIIPVKHNGTYSSDNIQALCLSCNSSKSAHLDKQFIQIWTLI